MADEIKTYRPSKFVVGFYDSSVNVGFKCSNSDAKTLFGYPSCKWLGDGKWTNVSTFSRLTGGYKPHAQRDCEKQMLKDIGTKLEEVSNDLVSGFTVLGIHHSGIANGSCCVLRDPRGWAVNVDRQWLEKAIFKHGCSVSSNGEVSGKWFYAWSYGSFAGIWHESELDTIDTDDDLLASQKNQYTSFKLADLEVGKIYDMASDSGDKTDVTRVVYLGQYTMRRPSSVQNYLYKGYDVNCLGRYYSSIVSSSDDDLKTLDSMPWAVELEAKKALLVQKRELLPVFVKLHDRIGYAPTSVDNKNEWYADELVKTPEEDLEHSIVYAVRKDYSSTLVGKEYIKRLVKVSECQDLKVIEKPGWARTKTTCWKEVGLAYTDESDYKILKLKMLQDAFEKFLVKSDKLVDDKLKLVPGEVPADLKAWRKRVAEWKLTTYDRERASHRWW